MARKCRQCRTEIPPKKKCPDQIQAGGFCNIECLAAHGREKAQKARERKEKKVRAKARADVKELNRNDLSWQHKQCQRVFNRMRVLEEKLWFRERGLEPECISCGKKNMDWCCGHLKSRGAQSNLRYDRNNTFLQCNKACNESLSGNIEGTKTTRGYKQGLADRFGEGEAGAIIDYCESRTAPYKWNCEELEQWRKEWNKRTRELERRLESP